MKKISTAWFISYDIRPSKQIERKLVFECIQSGRVAPLSIEKLPFIGMGGVRYIDFLLAHRILGITTFTSIEHDKNLIPRCKFNQPFTSIKIHRGTTFEFLNEIGLNNPSIVWLDYEMGISENLLEEITLLTSKAQPGSFVSVTANAQRAKEISESDDARSKEYYKEQIGSFAESLSSQAFSKEIFPLTVARLLSTFFVSGFGGRTDGKFFPFLRIVYKDSTWMATAGGFFGQNEHITSISLSLGERFAFLKPDSGNDVYEIGQFNITDAERRLFDRAALAADSEKDAKNSLAKLGFDESIIDQYRSIMRFIPRYFETLL